MALCASFGLLLGFFMGLAAACQGGPLGGLDDPRPVQGEDLTRLQDWGRQVGEDWLRQSTGLDLATYQLHWKPGTFDLTYGPPPPPSGPSLGPSAGLAPGGDQAFGGWTLRLEQSDNLSRLLHGDDVADVIDDLPFRMEMDGRFPGFRRIRTKLFVPLSWRDEFRAEAQLPLLTGLDHQPWWGGLGLGSKLSLRSDFSSRLGKNLVEAGLATDWNTNWAGDWALDLDLRKDYGQGNNTASQWLRLSRGF